MHVPFIKQLSTYPLKSGSPSFHEKIEVVETGLLHDRELSLVDQNGELITGRTHPILTRFQTEIADNMLFVNGKSFELSISEDTKVQHFDVNFMAHNASIEASKYFSDLLGEKVSLVRNSVQQIRKIKAKYELDGPLSMTDSGPILLINQKSLDDLNSRLSEEVPALRFRPNIVIDDAPAYDELNWSQFQIADIDFKLMSICKRCNFINLNYDSLQFDKEPLRTMAKYSTDNENHVIFGIYIVPLNKGELKIGDKISF